MINRYQIIDDNIKLSPDIFDSIKNINKRYYPSNLDTYQNILLSFGFDILKINSSLTHSYTEKRGTVSGYRFGNIYAREKDIGEFKRVRNNTGYRFFEKSPYSKIDYFSDKTINKINRIKNNFVPETNIIKSWLYFNCVNYEEKNIYEYGNPEDKLRIKKEGISTLDNTYSTLKNKIGTIDKRFINDIYSKEFNSGLKSPFENNKNSLENLDLKFSSRYKNLKEKFLDYITLFHEDFSRDHLIQKHKLLYSYIESREDIGSLENESFDHPFNFHKYINPFLFYNDPEGFDEYIEKFLKSSSWYKNDFYKFFFDYLLNEFDLEETKKQNQSQNLKRSMIRKSIEYSRLTNTKILALSFNSKKEELKDKFKELINLLEINENSIIENTYYEHINQATIYLYSDKFLNKLSLKNIDKYLKENLSFNINCLNINTGKETILPPYIPYLCETFIYKDNEISFTLITEKVGLKNPLNKKGLKSIEGKIHEILFPHLYKNSQFTNQWEMEDFKFLFLSNEIKNTRERFTPNIIKDIQCYEIIAQSFKSKERTLIDNVNTQIYQVLANTKRFNDKISIKLNHFFKTEKNKDFKIKIYKNFIAYYISCILNKCCYDEAHPQLRKELVLHKSFTIEELQASLTCFIYKIITQEIKLDDDLYSYFKTCENLKDIKNIWKKYLNIESFNDFRTFVIEKILGLKPQNYGRYYKGQCKIFGNENINIVEKISINLTKNYKVPLKISLEFKEKNIRKELKNTFNRVKKTIKEEITSIKNLISNYGIQTTFIILYGLKISLSITEIDIKKVIKEISRIYIEFRKNYLINRNKSEKLIYPRTA